MIKIVYRMIVQIVITAIEFEKFIRAFDQPMFYIIDGKTNDNSNSS